jgi:ketosteroid isomerase-like protein
MTARLEPPVPSRAGRSVPPVLALCLLLGAVALPGALLGCGDARADADAIRSLVNREVAAINGKDLRALSEIWSKDKDILMFDVPPPGRFRGWDQIGRLWKDFFDKVTEIRLTVDAVQAEAQGSLGYATYDWSMTGRLGSYALEDRGQATAIYRKEGGQWRLIHAHYSPVPPALGGQEKPGPPASGEIPHPGGAAPQAAPSPSPAGRPSPAPGQAPKTP